METGEQGYEATEEQRERALRRRTLLKAAVGTGATVAAFSVSEVPAYGLTTSSNTDNWCYGFGWSGNNPSGKGWMALGDQPDTRVNDSVYPGNANYDSTPPALLRVMGPNRKETNNSVPGSATTCGNGTWTDSKGAHSGAASCTECVIQAPAKGPVRYTWTITKLPPLGPGTFDLTLTLSGSVNGLGTSVTVSGLPAGYCVDFYNDGVPSFDAPSTLPCGYATDLSTVGGKLTMSSQTTGFISDFTNTTACDDGGNGKTWWHFDVVPCPAGGGFYP